MARLLDLTWPRHTARLLLRPMVLDDLGAVHSYRRLPEVAEWLPSDGADLAYFTTRYFGEHIGNHLVAEWRGQVISDVMVRLGDGWAQREVEDGARGVEAELGYAFDPAVAGQGLATEAAAEALALCFRDLGVRRVTASCSPTTSRPGACSNGSACAARGASFAMGCTAGAVGWTVSPMRCSPPSGLNDTAPKRRRDAPGAPGRPRRLAPVAEPLDALIALDRRSLAIVDHVLAGSSATDLSRPTPCAGWNLADLLRHQISENTAFALAARRGSATDWTTAASLADSDDLVLRYRRSVDDVIKAFVVGAAPEMAINTFGTFPRRVALTMHLIDSVVHGWDFARTLGVDYLPDPDAVRACLPMAQSIPDTDAVRSPGASFAHAVAVDDGTDLDRLLGLLGRDPAWSPA